MTGVPRTEAVKRVPVSGGHVVLIDAADAPLVDGHRWTLGDERYAYRRVYAGGKRRKAYMHRAIMGVLDAPSRVKIDHVNGDTLDNRRRNLRVCTHSQNLANRGRPASNTSGYKGVFWEKRRRHWVAQISVQGKHVYVGSFDDPREAAIAHDDAAVAHFGQFANLNFPDRHRVAGVA